VVDLQRIDQARREQADQALFNRIAGRYATKDIAPSCSIARKSQLLDALHPILRDKSSLGTIVDVGCGTGAPARYLTGLYEQYIGIDQSAEMTRVAKSLYSQDAKVQFFTNNARTIGLPTNTADTVLAIGALHHFVELHEVMCSLVRIAKSRAFIVAIEPQRGNPFVQLLRWSRGRLDASYSRDQVFFSEQFLRRLFADHGLTDLSVRFQGYLSPPFAQVVMNPQFFFARLSRIASQVDGWLAVHLPIWLHKLSFNLSIVGRVVK
jgi:SAM-dependent methyltransferase